MLRGHDGRGSGGRSAGREGPQGRSSGPTGGTKAAREGGGSVSAGGRRCTAGLEPQTVSRGIGMGVSWPGGRCAAQEHATGGWGARGHPLSAGRERGSGHTPHGRFGRSRHRRPTARSDRRGRLSEHGLSGKGPEMPCAVAGITPIGGPTAQGGPWGWRAGRGRSARGGGVRGRPGRAAF
jgi:hypothetical protein